MKKLAIYGLSILAMAFGLTPGLRADATLELPTTARLYQLKESTSGGLAIVTQKERSHIFACTQYQEALPFRENLDRFCAPVQDQNGHGFNALPIAYLTSITEFHRLKDDRYLFLGSEVDWKADGYVSSAAIIINFDPKNPDVLTTSVTGLIQTPTDNPKTFDLKVLTAKKVRESSFNYHELTIQQTDI